MYVSMRFDNCTLVLWVVPHALAVQPDRYKLPMCQVGRMWRHQWRRLNQRHYWLFAVPVR